MAFLCWTMLSWANTHTKEEAARSWGAGMPRSGLAPSVFELSRVSRCSPAHKTRELGINHLQHGRMPDTDTIVGLGWASQDLFALLGVNFLWKPAQSESHTKSKHWQPRNWSSLLQAQFKSEFTPSKYSFYWKFSWQIHLHEATYLIFTTSLRKILKKQAGKDK